ncbi:MAG: hypothetical protein ABIG84_04960 [archaeon]
MNIDNRKEQVDYWLKNRDYALRSGRLKEVKRINKILSFYGHRKDLRDIAS